MLVNVRDTQLFVDIDGAKLAFEGTTLVERPTVFLIHGGPGNDHVGMKPRYGLLNNRAQLVYFDQRGHGRSARGDPRSYTLDENVEDLEALRRYLGTGPIVSFGTSYGGIVAMAHAARYPDSVSHLILVATLSHGGYVAKARERIAQIGSAEQIAACEDMFEGRLDTADKLRRFFAVMGPLYSRKYDPQAGVGQGASTLTPEPFNRAHGPDGFLRHLDLRPQLSRITVPTLICAGRHDWICPPEFAEEIHQHIPGSDLRIFEESSHTLGTDELPRLLDVIAGFLVYNGKRR